MAARPVTKYHMRGKIMPRVNRANEIQVGHETDPHHEEARRWSDGSFGDVPAIVSALTGHLALALGRGVRLWLVVARVSGMLVAPAALPRLARRNPSRPRVDLLSHRTVGPIAVGVMSGSMAPLMGPY
jgi:type IV secretory pathway TrbD component